MSGNGSKNQAKVLRLDAKDNVLVALADLRKGETVSYLGNEYILLSDVAAKHKFVTQDVSAGGEIIMYGVLVGHALESLRRGDLLSTRNIRHAAAAFQERESGGARWTPPNVSAWADKTFLGYHRDDGQVGSRNYWLVLPLVFCENRNLAVLKQAFEEELGFAAPQIYRSQVAELARLYREGKSEELKRAAFGEMQRASASPRVFRNLDGIKFLLHEAGCGGTHEDARNLCGLLAGYIHHPNVAGATVLSLGCQHAQVPMLLEEIKKRDPNFKKPVLIFEQQKSPSEAAMMSRSHSRDVFGNGGGGQDYEAAGAAFEIDVGIAMRRLGWIFRAFGESGNRACVRHCCGAWRNRDSFGISGIVRCGAAVDRSVRAKRCGGAIWEVDEGLRGAGQGGAREL